MPYQLSPGVPVVDNHETTFITVEANHSSQYSFSYEFVGALDEKEVTEIHVRKGVATEELVDLAQAFYEFLLDAGFPAVERVTIATTEDEVVSQNTSGPTDGSNGSDVA